MKKALTLFIALLLVSSISSCEKKEEEKKEVSKEELIQSHVWKGVEVKTFVNGTETNTTPITEYEFTYDANKDYTIKQNGTVEFSGTWEYVKGNPDILKLTDSNSVTKEYSIDKLTEDKFELSIDDSGTTYKYFLIK